MNFNDNFTTSSHDRFNKRRRSLFIRGITYLIVIVTLIISLVLTFISPIRFDFAGGSHIITPTAVDTDMWGNYTVYYKTSDYTPNTGDDVYYIEKDNNALVEQINQAMRNKQEIIVYYDKYVGWKGFTAPKTSPIVKVELIEKHIQL